MITKKKDFTYRGKNLKELKELGVREFAKLIISRQKRNLLRNFQKVEDFMNRSNKKMQKGKVIKTHQRDMIVVPQMVGMKILVHYGNGFMPVEITGEMLGHKLGEFAPSRKRVNHGSAGVGATKGTKHKSKK